MKETQLDREIIVEVKVKFVVMASNEERAKEYAVQDTKDHMGLLLIEEPEVLSAKDAK